MLYVVTASRLPLEMVERVPHPITPAPGQQLNLLFDVDNLEDAEFLFQDNYCAFGGWLEYYEINKIEPFNGQQCEDCTHWVFDDDEQFNEFTQEVDDIFKDEL